MIVNVKQYDGKQGLIEIDGFPEKFSSYTMEGDEYLFNGMHITPIQTSPILGEGPTEWISFDAYKIVSFERSSNATAIRVEDEKTLEKLANQILLSIRNCRNSHKLN